MLIFLSLLVSTPLIFKPASTKEFLVTGCEKSILADKILMFAGVLLVKLNGVLKMALLALK